MNRRMEAGVNGNVKLSKKGKVKIPTSAKKDSVY